MAALDRGQVGYAQASPTKPSIAMTDQSTRSNIDLTKILALQTVNAANTDVESLLQPHAGLEVTPTSHEPDLKAAV